MKPHLIFYISQETRNSISALIAGIEYFCKDIDIEIKYASSLHEIIRLLSSSTLNMIALSVTTVNFAERYILIQEIKKKTDKTKNILYIAGGPHADGDPDSLINAGFDYVFSGYSEESFPLFIKNISEHADINPPRIIRGKTSLLWQNRSFAKFAADYFPPLEIQRGCRFRCTYCQSCTRLNIPIYKSKDAIDEYIEDFHSHKFKRFSFVSPDAFDIRISSSRRSPENMEALFEYLNLRGITIIEYGQFPSEIRPSRDAEIFFGTLARYTKNRKVVIGAQSFLNERLRKVRRSHTEEEIESTMYAACKYGFYSIVDIILGFPDETPDERLYTLNRFRELNKKYPSRLHVHYFLPLAGTDMYKSNPSVLDRATLELLNKLEKDGRAKGWWREGEKMTEKIIRMRDRFSN